MRKIYIIFLLLVVCCTLNATAGNENFPVGARSAAMGNASVSFSDVWSVHHNQAGLAFLRGLEAGVYYENRFMVKELGLKNAAVAIPVKVGAFGLSITNFGYSAYSENKYSLSYAQAFGKKFSMGVAMDYMTTKIAEGYGSKGVFVAEIGLMAKPLKNLTIGGHLFNPAHVKLADYNNERVPTIIRLGLNYAFSKKVTVALENEKDISKKSIFKVGLEYSVVKELYLRAGISTNPNLTSFGFGINLKHFKVDVSANYHQVLGVSPQFSLLYSLAKEPKKSSKKKDDDEEKDDEK